MRHGTLASAISRCSVGISPNKGERDHDWMCLTNIRHGRSSSPTVADPLTQ